MNEKFFDEKSSKWIYYYKAITVAFFVIICIGGLVFAIVDAIDSLVFEDAVISILFWPIIGLISAFSMLIPSMMLINMCINIQLIRENTDFDRKKHSSKKYINPNINNHVNHQKEESNYDTSVNFEEMEEFLTTNFPEEYKTLISYADPFEKRKEYEELVRQSYKAKKQ